MNASRGKKPPTLAPRRYGAAIIREEARALSRLAASLSEPFDRAVRLLQSCADSGGTVLVTGLGKSGLIGAKISATLASLGIPSHSVHPAEAAHGDLGRFRASDTVICISYSGRTDEVVNLASILRQDGLPIISITGGSPTRKGAAADLERLATVSLKLGDLAEAGGGDFVAPTSSTTATLALGDALALATARKRKFSRDDFARRHPGGSLGGLLRPVTKMLRFVAGKNLALIPQTASVSQALALASKMGRRPGAMVIVEPRSGRLSGLFTDGDLRRLVMRDPAELSRPIARVMTRKPRCLPHTAKIAQAVRMVREFRQDEIPVVDARGKPVGILDVQDLIAMRLVDD